MRRLLPLLLLIGCSHPATEPSAEASDAGETRVPVQLGTARQMTFEETVQAPGATQALFEHKVRAPFPGTVARLSASDGARVSQGQVVAELLSQESEAAIAGAEAMAKAARTPHEKSDAARALELARSSGVTRLLRAPVSGVVLAHHASAGDVVASGDELLTIADPRAIVFVAQVVQTDLPRVHAGDPVTVSLASVEKPIPGKVQGVLPSESAAALTGPVRIDLSSQVTGVGLFGTATIVTGRRTGALGVPRSALLRDDVSGVTRVARVAADGTAHWVEVRPGLTGGDWVELAGSTLRPGDRVITGGQVGLPEGAKVIEAR